MSQDYILPVAFLVFFAAIIISRFIIMNALKKLTDEEKAQLLSSKIINQSQTRLLIVFAVLGVYYFAILKYPEYAKILLTGFVIVIIVSRIITYFITKKKLQSLQLPQFYITAFTTSSLIYNVGIMAVFFIIMQNYL